METSRILPFTGSTKRFSNLNEFAEPAIILPNTPNDKAVNHFIEANTIEVEMAHLRNECICPVFSKDNELTISHPAFVETARDAVSSFFAGEEIREPQIRASHIVKGRTPEAIHKPANQLLATDKTIYYERCAFSIDIPSIHEMVGGNKLNLSIVGVRAYNRENLYSKKTAERFSVGIGFKNQVCCNMCLFTDGYQSNIEVTNTTELYRALLELINNYNPAKQIHLMQTLCNTSMSEHQFCQILGKMRLYQCLSQEEQRKIPKLRITDTQINNVAKSYINDTNFCNQAGELNMWRFYNLLTGANKSSYIDSFLDRAQNTTEIAVGINRALHGDEQYKWFID